MARNFSHADDPVPDDGQDHGNSRRWGDASVEVKRRAQQKIIDEAKEQNLSKKNTANLIALAKVESALNPDARRSLLPGETKEVMTAKIARATACIASRTRINNTCYRGGDDGHKQQIIQACRTIAACWALRRAMKLRQTSSSQSLLKKLLQVGKCLLGD